MLEIRDLSFSYIGEKKVLDGINLSLDKGLFCLIGPSGCGKSTLCLALNGLIPQSIPGKLEGRITVGKLDTQKKPVSEIARFVGLVFQNPDSQLFSLCAEDEIGFGPCNLGLPWKVVSERVDESIGLLDIPHLRNKSPEEMSSGEKQKVAIASALSMKPRILVLDEPTANLDPVSGEEIFRIAKRLGKKMLVFMAEHDIDKVMSYADRVGVMARGRLEIVGEPHQVINHPDFQKYLELPEVARAGALVGLKSLPLAPQDLARKIRLRKRLPRERAFKNGKAIIETKSLEFGYEQAKPILKGISLKIHRGEFVAIVGGNGAGKSTLVAHFNGLLKPTKGEVRVGGKSTRGQEVSALARKVGYVFQNPDLQIFEDTLLEEVSFGPRNIGLSKSETSGRVEEALRSVGLWEFRNADPFSLSVGQKRRVTIASVLSMKPEAVIVDEPSTGLDPRTSEGVMALLRKMNREGKTIILVTHDMDLVAQFARRCIVMDSGRIVADGTVREVFSDMALLEKSRLMRPEISKVGALIGEPQIATISDLLRCVS
ncbi:MAG: ATP-binding cassette domain-containing protein [Candidatus Aenigmarchaeota archaeon]|nr:ATP-binding cassette domain-containing protein [Candidatus Aenigmarchaeota archaeon]